MQNVKKYINQWAHMKIICFRTERDLGDRANAMINERLIAMIDK